MRGLCVSASRNCNVNGEWEKSVSRRCCFRGNRSNEFLVLDFSQQYQELHESQLYSIWTGCCNDYGWNTKVSDSTKFIFEHQCPVELDVYGGHQRDGCDSHL